MMSQQRPFVMVGGNNYPSQNIDTTFTKVFVGGLAWETQRDTMRRYFEQFGEILEAVVITDKNTGRSKGYGFVTFNDPEAAMRACENPSPVIDGRRANCNLAYLGASKTRPATPQHGGGRFRPATRPLGPPGYDNQSSSFFHQFPGQYTFPHPAYGNRYSGYSQDTMFPMNYYSGNGGHQQFSPYYYTGASSRAGLMHNFYPFYAHYGQSSQTHGYGIQYPQMIQVPNYLPPHYGSAGILSLPSSVAMPATTTPGTTATAAVAGSRLSITAGATSSLPSAAVSGENPSNPSPK